MTIKITIPSTEWVNVTALSGVSAGATFNITNQGSRVLLLSQGAAAPNSDDEAEQMTTMAGFYAKARISGAEPLWAKAVGGMIGEGWAVVTEVV